MASVTVVYEENFDGFTNGPVAGQGGWTTSQGAGLAIHGKKMVGQGSNRASAHTFTVGAAAQTISIEMMLRVRRSRPFDMLIALNGPAGHLFQFGTNSAGWRMLSSDGSALTLPQPSNDEKLADNSHRHFDIRVDYNFLTETGSLNARNKNGDTHWSVLHTFTSRDLELTAAEKLPENWSGLTITTASPNNSIDNIKVTTTP